MKTKSSILEGLESEMESVQIMIRLEEKGKRIPYDALQRNLKQRYEDGLLNRQAKGVMVNQNTQRKHWNNYYRKKSK